MDKNISWYPSFFLHSKITERTLKVGAAALGQGVFPWGRYQSLRELSLLLPLGFSKRRPPALAGHDEDIFTRRLPRPYLFSYPQGSVSLFHKTHAREKARERRRTFIQTLSPHDMERLSSSQKHLFLEHFPLTLPHVLAGYWPLSDECDTRLLLENAYHQGVQVCLPRVEETALIFHLWHPQDSLTQSQQGVWEPQRAQITCNPTHVLVPLLAFDMHGYRLGYGGGFYDRALSSLYQKNPSLLTIGYAFECQYVDFLPHDRQDWPLDYVITPEKVYAFKT